MPKGKLKSKIELKKKIRNTAIMWFIFLYFSISDLFYPSTSWIITYLIPITCVIELITLVYLIFEYFKTEP